MRIMLLLLVLVFFAAAQNSYPEEASASADKAPVFSALSKMKGSFTYRKVPLKDVLADFNSWTKITFTIDKGVDPSSLISCDFRNITVLEAFNLILKVSGFECAAPNDNTVTIYKRGDSPSTSSKKPSKGASLSSEIQKTKRKLATKFSFDWKDMTLDELVEALRTKADVRIFAVISPTMDEARVNYSFSFSNQPLEKILSDISAKANLVYELDKDSGIIIFNFKPGEATW